MICEVKQNKIKFVFILSATSHLLSSVDTIGNRLLTTDEIYGLKIFEFKKKFFSPNLIVEKKDINWIVGSKIFDPISFLIWDRLGKIYFFRIGKYNSILNKKIVKTFKRVNIHLLASFKTKTIFKRISCFTELYKEKTKIVFASNINGTICTFTILNNNILMSILKQVFLIFNFNEKKKKTFEFYFEKNFNIINGNKFNLVRIIKKILFK